ncbi:amino acid ABC transporter permease [Marinomonas sp. GJ51-6]|uniref:amino acid ABC transporter permease n=1 Tax=Marinomonas sp. GJ51-6 TaxID=2992802 RepID=UPI002934410A|nr:amino acid ABC transporter permease [Marinomonas sp. GJ51-6]WOD08569.1 amino acid ABC transporter permease [Marinomonas sp. GJ51-6]
MVFDWGYLFSLFSLPDFWSASLTVVQLSIASWLISIVFGFVLALGRQSKYGVLNIPAKLYIWLFRSLPLLVLLMFVYNMPLVFPASGEFLSNPFFAGLLAMVLCESAYIAEIHRGGLLSIAKGQGEAAKALGIRFVGAQYLVIIPQAFRVALPALTNELVSIVKLTSLVSVVSLTEILLVGQRLYTQNFLVLETMAAVAIFYVMIVTVFDFLLRFLENALDVTKAKPKQQLSEELMEQISNAPQLKAEKAAEIDELCFRSFQVT